MRDPSIASAYIAAADGGRGLGCLQREEVRKRAASGLHGNTEVVALAPPLAGAPVSGVRIWRCLPGSQPCRNRDDRSFTDRLWFAAGPYVVTIFYIAPAQNEAKGPEPLALPIRAAPHHPVAHPRPGTQALMAPCEWCEKKSDELSPIRDWEEHGSFAPRESIWCAHSASRNTAKALRSRRRSGRPTWSPATPLHPDDRHHPDLNAEDGVGTTERPKVCPPRYLPAFVYPSSRCTHQAGEHVKHGFSLHPWVRPPPLTACCRGDQLPRKPPTALVAAQFRLRLAGSVSVLAPGLGEEGP